MTSDPESPQRIARLTPLGEVLARVDALVEPVPPRQVESATAVGRVVAGDAPVALHPRVPLALRDGWAVSSDLTSDASSYAPALLPAAARIDAGQPMPVGADAVAPLDVVVRRHGQIDFRQERGADLAQIGIGLLDARYGEAHVGIALERARNKRLQGVG